MQVVILRSVSKVKSTQYCTCAAENRPRWGTFPAMDRVLYHIGVRTLYARGIFREQRKTRECASNHSKCANASAHADASANDMRMLVLELMRIILLQKSFVLKPCRSIGLKRHHVKPQANTSKNK